MRAFQISKIRDLRVHKIRDLRDCEKFLKRWEYQNTLPVS